MKVQEKSCENRARVKSRIHETISVILQCIYYITRLHLSLTFCSAFGNLSVDKYDKDSIVM